MSDDLQRVAAEAAYEVQQRIIQRARQIKTLWVDLARDLYHFEQAQMFRDLGYTSFGSWMEDPDVDVESGWGYQLLSMWKELVVKRGIEAERLKGLNASKIQVILPAVRRGHDVEDALADVESLGRQDLRDRYHGSSSKPSSNGSGPDTSTRYEATDEEPKRFCPACGQEMRNR